MKHALALVAVLLLSTAVQAGLTYSGDDISLYGGTGTATMTISAVDGSSTLWELDITRQTYNLGTMFDRFTDSSGVNYAAPGGWGAGLWSVEGNGGAGATWTQVEKSANRYSFQVVRTSGNFELTTVFNINMADVTGTHWTAVHTVTNIGVAAQEPYGLFDWRLAVTDGGYHGVDGYALDGTSGGANRSQTDGVGVGPWQVNENVDRGATNINTSGILYGRATVLDNAASQALGMTTGLIIEAGSDTLAYYPADSIGDADVNPSGATYHAEVFVAATPREFMGGSRAENVPIDPGASYVGNAYLDVNISTAIPEPATMGLLGVGVLGLVLRRRKK